MAHFAGMLAELPETQALPMCDVRPFIVSSRTTHNPLNIASSSTGHAFELEGSCAAANM